jgi:8-oxo-dGTP diphosphatase
MEPEKCEEWRWVKWDQILNWANDQIEREGSGVSLPLKDQAVLFAPIINFIRDGYVPWRK